MEVVEVEWTMKEAETVWTVEVEWTMKEAETVWRMEVEWAMKVIESVMVSRAIFTVCTTYFANSSPVYIITVA